MRIKEIIAQTSVPNTIESIKTDLVNLGIQKGDVIIVHTAFSQLGWVVGGPPALIDALMQIISQSGTIVVPTQSSSNTDPRNWENPPIPEAWHELVKENYPPYRPDVTPTSGMGVIPELFRTYPHVLRSNHPTGSFAAWGKFASKIIDNHQLEYGLGNGSPLEKIYDLDGKVLLIGATHASNTSLHLAEDRANYPSKKYEMESAAVLVDGLRKRVEWKQPVLETADFEKIGSEFETKEFEEYWSTGKIGKASCKLLSQRVLVDFAIEWMEKHRK